MNGERELAELAAEPLATVPEFFIERVIRTPAAVAMLAFQQGQWQQVSWQVLGDRVAGAAAQLRALGLRQGEPIVTVCENRPEWIELDLAIQICRGVHVPLSPLLTGPYLMRLIAHSNARWIFVSDAAQARKLLACDATIRSRLICLEENNEGVASWLSWQGRGAAVEFESLLRRRGSLPRGDDLLSIIYTSGTTGRPKGVMLSQSNVTSNALAKLATLRLTETDLRLAWLPWTHIFGRTCDVYTGIISGCQTVVSRGKESLFEELRQFSPTYLNGVPYFYDKCHRELLAAGTDRDSGSLRGLLGGRIELCNCGGAPLSDTTFDFFRSQRVTLVCGYGLTESSPVLTSNRIDAWRARSVGQAVPGVEIAVAYDGEILARGPNIMRGYFRDEEQTSTTLVKGWLHTGDLGRLDGDGFLYVEGRKKDLIVLNTGMKVSPSPLEHSIGCHPLIHQCLVVGDRRDYLAALVTLNPREMEQCWPGIAEACAGQLVNTDSRVLACVQSLIDEALSDFAPHEQVRALAIINQPFGLEDDLTTAKMSLRREAIQKKYAALVESLYGRRVPGESSQVS